MELRFVVPNMEKTFGNLEFAGENTTEQQRINGRMAVITSGAGRRRAGAS